MSWQDITTGFLNAILAHAKHFKMWQKRSRGEGTEPAAADAVVAQVKFP